MVSLYSFSKLEAGWETNAVTSKRLQGAGTLPQPTIVLLGKKRKGSAAHCSLFFVVVLQACRCLEGISRATIILYAQRCGRSSGYFWLVVFVGNDSQCGALGLSALAMASMSNI